MKYCPYDIFSMTGNVLRTSFKVKTRSDIFSSHSLKLSFLTGSKGGRTLTDSAVVVVPTTAELVIWSIFIDSNPMLCLMLAIEFDTELTSLTTVATVSFSLSMDLQMFIFDMRSPIED